MTRLLRVRPLKRTAPTPQRPQQTHPIQPVLFLLLVLMLMLMLVLVQVLMQVLREARARARARARVDPTSAPPRPPIASGSSSHARPPRINAL